jgi:hypothetical protein
MPYPFALSRLERLYLTLEDPSAYGIAVAPVAANYARHIKLEMSNQGNLLNRRDKTGSRSALKGERGRVAAKWSLSASLVTNGTANTTPHDAIFQMLFGQAASSGTYNLSDNILCGNLWSYRRPSTVEQRVALGAVLQNFTFTLGQDVAEFQVDGEAGYILGSNFMGAADTFQKGGLTAFPDEPSTGIADTSRLIAGFTGSLVVDGITLAHIRTATIKGSTGNALVKDDFGTFYPSGAEGDERNVTFGFSVYDDDSTDLETLKEAADSKTPVDAVVTVGTVTHNKFQFTVKGVQLENPALDDNQRRYVAQFGDSRAHTSALTSTNELSLAIS